MNILITSIFNSGTYSRGIMMEQLQLAIESAGPNDKIFYLGCFQTFDTCYFNPTSDPAICYGCASNAEENLKYMINGNFTKLKLRQLITHHDIKAANDFFNNTLITRDLKHQNFEIGEAAISSYISKTRDKDLHHCHESSFLKKVAYNSFLVFESVKRFIKVNKIDKVISFNGRMDYLRAILRASEANSIDCYNYERSRPGGYLEYFVNKLPHDIMARKILVDKFWEESSLPEEEKIELGSSFFIRKKKGEYIIGKSYTMEQVANQLPAGIDINKENFVVYNSSEDELVAVGDEYKNPFFEDQNQGVKYLVELFGKHFPESNLIIRMHPNLKDVVDLDYAKEIIDLHQKYANVFIVRPDSTIDTYALMELADKVVVFGSTIGMESSYWGKPVILLGKGRYYYSNIAYIPKDISDIKRLIEVDLAPKPQLDSIKYGFYYVAGGIKAKYYTSEGLNDKHYFKGHLLNYYTKKQKINIKLLKAIYKLSGNKIRLKKIF